jgi:dolichol-phosphate mannosyltransferase
MVATARGRSVALALPPGLEPCVSVLVPVLDEERRLGPCLDALCAQVAGVQEILVIDGGSRDATRALIRSAAERDARVRLIDGSSAPGGWNGKAWNLEAGLRASDAACRYVLTIDADVRVAASLVASLVAHAETTGVRAFSVATDQQLADAPSGVFHPSMLTTLVYRFGLPGSATASVARVQANGQCFFASRALLIATDSIALARDSRCEDVTIARAIAAGDTPVGFYQSAGLARVSMYENWREMLTNWPRSLPMLDRYSGAAGWIGLIEVLLVQALPPWIAAALLLAGVATPFEHALLAVLIAMRLGTACGTRAAYIAPPPTYWLAPLVDLPVAALLIASALRRRHTWRGRTLVPSGAL